MSKEKDTFEVGDRVVVRDNDQAGVVESFEMPTFVNAKYVFTVALDNGETRHYTVDQLTQE